MEPERRRIFYSGRVQGVGFRATTLRVARDFPVLGFVRNRPDGRVEVVVQGPDDAVLGFLRAVDDALGRFIASVDARPEAPTDDLADFSIRYNSD